MLAISIIWLIALSSLTATTISLVGEMSAEVGYHGSMPLAEDQSNLPVRSHLTYGGQVIKAGVSIHNSFEILASLEVWETTRSLIADQTIIRPSTTIGPALSLRWYPRPTTFLETAASYLYHQYHGLATTEEMLGFAFRGGYRLTQASNTSSLFLIGGVTSYWTENHLAHLKASIGLAWNLGGVQ